MSGDIARRSGVRWMAFVLSLIALGWSLAAVAADDCQDMTAITGAPEYKGTAPDHTVLCRKGYVLSHNTKRLTPDWVLEVLSTSRFKGDGNRSGLKFRADPDLPDGERSQPKDYSSKEANPQSLAQGHMAPAADMKFSQDAMKESFYLSNIAPQVGPGLNSGIWSDLERLTRQWICGHGDLVVISGPIYGDRPTTIGDGKVAVPTGFYKIVYDRDRKRVIAFVLPNKVVDKKGKKAAEALKQFMVKVGDIEDQVGLSFLDGLSKRDRTRLLNMTPAMWGTLDEC